MRHSRTTLPLCALAIVIGCSKPEPATDAPLLAAHRVDTVSSAEGAGIVYEVHGDSAGKPGLVLVHCWSVIVATGSAGSRSFPWTKGLSRPIRRNGDSTPDPAAISRLKQLVGMWGRGGRPRVGARGADRPLHGGA